MFIQNAWACNGPETVKVGSERQPQVRVRSTSLTLLHVQFAEKFQEVKEAARLARDKSQEKIETSSNHSQVSGLSLNPRTVPGGHTAPCHTDRKGGI